MAVQQLLEFYGELRSGRESHGRGGELAEAAGSVEMGVAEGAMALSKGMSQKVQFIAAVVPAPKLLILDEPFSGLDPVSADALQSAILDLRRGGVTVILSTHDMQVAENMCDYICMIFRGKKVLDGTLASIQDQYGNDTIRVAAEGGAQFLDGLAGRGKDSRSGAGPGTAHDARLRSAAGAARR